jgi:hypothetical protein
MRALALISLLVISSTACSGMGGMYSGSSQTGSSYSSTQNQNLNIWNGFDSPVIDPRTGRLNLYHGG